MSNHTGNISTIVKMVLLTVLPYIIADTQTQDQVISIILAIVGLIIAYIDAKYPNTLAFLDNAPSLDEPAQVGERVHRASTTNRRKHRRRRYWMLKTQ